MRGEGHPRRARRTSTGVRPGPSPLPTVLGVLAVAASTRREPFREHRSASPYPRYREIRRVVRARSNRPLSAPRRGVRGWAKRAAHDERTRDEGGYRTGRAIPGVSGIAACTLARVLERRSLQRRRIGAATRQTKKRARNEPADAAARHEKYRRDARPQKLDRATTRSALARHQRERPTRGRYSTPRRRLEERSSVDAARNRLSSTPND